MATYNAPLRDIEFARDEVLELGKHYETLPGAEITSMSTGAGSGSRIPWVLVARACPFRWLPLLPN
jgi:hypothetical protein